MDDAGDRLVAECNRLPISLRKAKKRKSQRKKTCLHVQEKLSRALKQVAGLQVELGEAQDSLSARSAECDQ
uniref:BZIP domain-containing protein n=1 Tax=Peronospora matthiolae TaxID=2874970 RepID=A0AAV1UBT4_9STRA